MKCLFIYILKLYEYFAEIPMKLNYNLTSYNTVNGLTNKKKKE